MLFIPLLLAISTFYSPQVRAAESMAVEDDCGEQFVEEAAPAAKKKRVSKPDFDPELQWEWYQAYHRTVDRSKMKHSEWLASEHERALALQKLVRSLRLFAIKIADKWASMNPDVSREELHETAITALKSQLMRTDKPWDRKQGNARTFTKLWIEKDVRDYIKRNAGAVQFPHNGIEEDLFYNKSKYLKQLADEDLPPTPENIGEKMGLDKNARNYADQLDRIQRFMNMIQSGGLSGYAQMDATLPGNRGEEGEQTLHDRRETAVETTAQDILGESEQNDLYATLLREYRASTRRTPLERDIITLRWLRPEDSDPVTLEDIAKRHGVSRGKVQEAETKLKDGLKFFFGKRGLNPKEILREGEGGISRPEHLASGSSPFRSEDLQVLQTSKVAVEKFRERLQDPREIALFDLRWRAALRGDEAVPSLAQVAGRTEVNATTLTAIEKKLLRKLYSALGYQPKIEQSQVSGKPAFTPKEISFLKKKNEEIEAFRLKLSDPLDIAIFDLRWKPSLENEQKIISLLQLSAQTSSNYVTLREREVRLRQDLFASLELQHDTARKKNANRNSKPASAFNPQETSALKSNLARVKEFRAQLSDPREIAIFDSRWEPTLFGKSKISSIEDIALQTGLSKKLIFSLEVQLKKRIFEQINYKPKASELKPKGRPAFKPEEIRFLTEKAKQLEEFRQQLKDPREIALFDLRFSPSIAGETKVLSVVQIAFSTRTSETTLFAVEKALQRKLFQALGYTPQSNQNEPQGKPAFDSTEISFFNEHAAQVESFRKQLESPQHVAIFDQRWKPTLRGEMKVAASAQIAKQLGVAPTTIQKAETVLKKRLLEFIRKND